MEEQEIYTRKIRLEYEPKIDIEYQIYIKSGPGSIKNVNYSTGSLEFVLEVNGFSEEKTEIVYHLFPQLNTSQIPTTQTVPKTVVSYTDVNGEVQIPLGAIELENYQNLNIESKKAFKQTRGGSILSGLLVADSVESEISLLNESARELKQVNLYAYLSKNPYYEPQIFLLDHDLDKELIQQTLQIFEYVLGMSPMILNEKAKELSQAPDVTQAYLDVLYKYKDVVNLSDQAIKDRIKEQGYEYLLEVFSLNSMELKILISYLPMIEALKGSYTGLELTLALLGVSDLVLTEWWQDPTNLEVLSYALSVEIINKPVAPGFVGKIQKFSRQYVYPLLAYILYSVKYDFSKISPTPYIGAAVYSAQEIQVWEDFLWLTWASDDLPYNAWADEKPYQDPVKNTTLWQKDKDLLWMTEEIENGITRLHEIDSRIKDIDQRLEEIGTSESAEKDELLREKSELQEEREKLPEEVLNLPEDYKWSEDLDQFDPKDPTSAPGLRSWTINPKSTSEDGTLLEWFLEKWEHGSLTEEEIEEKRKELEKRYESEIQNFEELWCLGGKEINESNPEDERQVRTHWSPDDVIIDGTSVTVSISSRPLNAIVEINDVIQNSAVVKKGIEVFWKVYYVGEGTQYYAQSGSFIPETDTHISVELKPMPNVYTLLVTSLTENSKIIISRRPFAADPSSFTAQNISRDKRMSADEGSILYWAVYAEHHNIQSGTVTLTEDTTITVELEEIQTATFSIVANPSSAVVKIKDRVQTSIEVDKGTKVNWSVAALNYVSQSGETVVEEDTTLNITLEPVTRTITLYIQPPEQKVVLDVKNAILYSTGVISAKAEIRAHQAAHLSYTIRPEDTNHYRAVTNSFVVDSSKSIVESLTQIAKYVGIIGTDLHPAFNPTISTVENRFWCINRNAKIGDNVYQANKVTHTHENADGTLITEQIETNGSYELAYSPAKNESELVETVIPTLSGNIPAKILAISKEGNKDVYLVGSQEAGITWTVVKDLSYNVYLDPDYEHTDKEY